MPTASTIIQPEESMMNHSTHVMHWPRRARPPAARTAAALIATAVLVLLAAACSSSPSSTGSGSSTNAGGSPSSGSASSWSASSGSASSGSASSGSASSQLVAYSQCMRSHGVPNFPDPQPGATNAKFLSAQQLGVSSSQYQSAENACQPLLPAGIDDQFPPAEVQLLLPGMREFSQCMRSHGVPNWPDPTVDSEGRPDFPLSEVPGHDRNYWRSPQVMTIDGDAITCCPARSAGFRSANRDGDG